MTGSIEDWARSCLGKVFCPSEVHALHVAAKAMRKYRGRQLYTYACKHCHGWHLTSKPPEVHQAQQLAAPKQAPKTALGGAL